MKMTIQQVDLESFAVAANDDVVCGNITIDGSRGETIFLQCRKTNFVAFTVEMVRVALDLLIKNADMPNDRRLISDGNISPANDHVACNVHVAADPSGYALVLNTLDEKKLRILLMPAQRDALLGGLMSL